MAGASASVRWQASDGPLPVGVLERVGAVVNLAGAPLTAGRWSQTKKAAILESRVATTRAVAAACAAAGVRVLWNASAVGVYGAAEKPVDETAPAGDDFLASVCVAWERAAHAAADDGVRVLVGRSAMVLAPDGGALPVLRRLARLGVLGPVGSGTQWSSWIHLDDELGALLHCLDHEAVLGPVNLASPRAVRQRDLAAAVRRAVRRPPALPAPAALVRAALGEASALVLAGQRAVPAVLDATGFGFVHPSLDEALRDLLAP